MSAAQKDPVTIPDSREHPEVKFTQTQVDALLDRAMERQPAAVAPAASAMPTKAQWGAGFAALLTVLGTFGGGSYLGVAKMTAAEIAAQDERNRGIVRSELKSALIEAAEERLADRTAFDKKITSIQVSVDKANESIRSIDQHLAILKDRETRK